MTRHLPWKTSTTPSSASKSRPNQQDSPRVSTPRSPSIPASSATPRFSSSRKPQRKRAVDAEDGGRSPSTSPPPEPPQEQFMIAGALNDDRYRMVEDELLSMAHQFTTHLHRAEYNRLKTQAKSQNADAIREIERPVVGKPTLVAQSRQESVRRLAKRRQAVGDSGGAAADTPWVGTSLQGLLESPRKEAKWIASGAATMATTRASAGFRSNLTSQPRLRTPARPFTSANKRVAVPVDEETTEGSDQDEDLATPSRVPRTAQSIRQPTSTPRPYSSAVLPRTLSSPQVSTPRPQTKGSTITESPFPQRTPQASSSENRKRQHENDDDMDDEDDDPFGINRRRIRRQQSKKQLQKTEQKPKTEAPSSDSIPSFI